ncbi:MAG: polymerase sigma factor, sigma-70 family [Frankiales bacterium]|nr:polymerase sigma factor, sigma-70 family [Frankiales bacterium]
MGSLYFQAAEASLEDLVAAAQADPNNDSIAMNEIVRRFEPKALSLASFITSDRHLQQDVANASRWGVVLAVRAHKSGTAGIAAYIATTMRGEAYRSIGRNVDERVTTVSSDAPVWADDDMAVEVTSVVESDLALLTAGLDDAQRALVFDRYVACDSVTEIATAHGTSVSAVSQRLKTIHGKVEGVAVRFRIKAA